MPRLQTFSQFADRGPIPAREGANLQEELILQWRDAVRSRCIFAESQKPPQCVAKFGELLELDL